MHSVNGSALNHDQSSMTMFLPDLDGLLDHDILASDRLNDQSEDET
jgi:hypothetical protein